GGEDRERVEHFSNPFFGLTPRGNATYDLHRLLFEGDLHIGDTLRTFIQFGNHLATAPSTSPPTDVDRLDLQQGSKSGHWLREATATDTAPYFIRWRRSSRSRAGSVWHPQHTRIVVQLSAA